jgi:hypothetical protein
VIRDIRELRGRTDLLEMPRHASRNGAGAGVEPPQAEHDSCRVGSLAVSEPVTVAAIWEAAARSFNGGNNRGGGIDFAGFAPTAVREKTCLILNTIGPDRADSLLAMLGHLAGCRFFDAAGVEHSLDSVRRRANEFRIPVRKVYADGDGWRRADLRENPGDFHMFFVEMKPEVLKRYGRTLLKSPHWLQRQTKYGDIPDGVLELSLESFEEAIAAGVETAVSLAGGAALSERLVDFLIDVREE